MQINLNRYLKTVKDLENELGTEKIFMIMSVKTGKGTDILGITTEENIKNVIADKEKKLNAYISTANIGFEAIQIEVTRENIFFIPLDEKSYMLTFAMSQIEEKEVLEES